MKNYKIIKVFFLDSKLLKMWRRIYITRRMSKHMAKSTATNKYPWTDCEWIFDSLPSLIDHTKNSHIVSENFYIKY